MQDDPYTSPHVPRPTPRPMRVPIRFGIISTFVFVTVLSFAFLAFWITNRIRPNYLKLVEENLVDTSRILAADLGEDLESGLSTQDSLDDVFERVKSESFESTIYEVTKEQVDLNVYVTDAKGIVLYHSSLPDQVSLNYSDWNNIKRTLEGAYGARTTPDDPEDKTQTLHVSAPILVDGNLVGVLTVEKPVAWAAIFIEDARKEIIYAAIITGGISLILSLLMSAWLLRPIGRLTQYARLASEGKRAYLPRLGKAKELQDMARALQTMHKELEGKQYVEQYIQSLTHEIKSPVSAIRGAAELMNEEMSVDQRNRFLSNIAVESKRINQIVDRLLELSAVEKLQQLEESLPLDLVALTSELLENYRAVFEAHNLQIQTELLDHAMIEGDSFLLARAIGNVLQNGIDFSPDGALVSILIDEEDSCYRLRVLDEGEGVPAFALEKVFERFFSMPRPATSKKSSGLGLAFVKEIMELHQGSVSIDNRDDAGVVVALKFPKS